jgi:hypothetical protein
MLPNGMFYFAYVEILEDIKRLFRGFEKSLDLNSCFTYCLLFFTKIITNRYTLSLHDLIKI